MVARFEEDDFPGEDRDVVISAGQASVLPRAASRLPQESRDLLALIQRRSLALVELEGELAGLTDMGREQGISWSILGAAQGLTGEALRRRSLEDS